jgi:predicted HicB family RNase H-like nuclease
MARTPNPQDQPTKAATIGIRTTEAVKAAAKAAAAKERRSVSQWIEHLIIAATEARRAKRGEGG